MAIEATVPQPQISRALECCRDWGPFKVASLFIMGTLGSTCLLPTGQTAAHAKKKKKKTPKLAFLYHNKRPTAAETKERAVTSPCITSAGGEGEAVTLQELRLTAAAAACRGHVVVFWVFLLFCFFVCGCVHFRLSPPTYPSAAAGGRQAAHPHSA